MVLRTGDVGSLWWLYVNLIWWRNTDFSKAQLGHVPGSVSENWVWRAPMSPSNWLIDSESDRQLIVCGDRGGWGLPEEVCCGRCASHGSILTPPLPAASLPCSPCIVRFYLTKSPEPIELIGLKSLKNLNQNEPFFPWTWYHMASVMCWIQVPWPTKPRWEELFAKTPRY